MRGRVLKFWFYLTLICLLAFVAVFNQEPIYFKIPLLGEFKMWTAVPLIASFIMGATIMAAYVIVDSTKMKLEIRRLKKRLGEQNISIETRGNQDTPTF